MGVQNILAEIDREINQLQQARALLKGTAKTSWEENHSHLTRRTVKKRNLTPEGRKRIAEAVKRRWARQKGQSAESTAIGS